MVSDSLHASLRESFDDDRSDQPGWWIYRGSGEVIDVDERTRRWPVAPPWRSFNGTPDQPTPGEIVPETLRRLGRYFPARTADRDVIERVNIAIALSQPLLVTGRPGSGKSSLAHSIARELDLGRVLRWSVTSRTTLSAGLYEYDAIGRAHAITMHENHDIGNFVHLGPLGTALLPYKLPRVLLIEGLDTSDFDLPADLSRVFEEGEFTIPELVRVRDREPQVVVHTADPEQTASVADGIVRCHAFPLIIVVSDGEREFSPTFTRQCVRLHLPDPDARSLGEVVAAHFSRDEIELPADLVETFAERYVKNDRATVDEFLRTLHLVRCGAIDQVDRSAWGPAVEAIWRKLSDGA
jgi:MoxR-like ATPase